MKYTRFEQLPVWRAAAGVGKRVLMMTDGPAFARRRGLADQLERAAISISNNIAEGFESGTTSQLITFVYYARGSAGETRSMLRVLAALPAISDLKSEISDLISQCDSISRQLRGWADHLQNTDIKGPRHLNDAARERYDRNARTEAFLSKLKQLNAAHPWNATGPDAVPFDGQP